MRIAQAIFIVLCVAACLAGCDRSSTDLPADPAGDETITIASLVPAASDLIDAMGARDQLVAVSNYDSEPIAQDLPRVGDYQNADWERLQRLRPDVMVIFQDPARVSPGWKQRAEELNIRLVNVRTETLADIYEEALRLGELIGRPQQAADLVQRMKTRLAAIQARVKDRPPVRTLVLMGSDVDSAAGRANFINDALEIAGGQNIIPTAGWPTLDREQIRQFAPEAILVLLSGVPEHVEQQARANVAELSEVPAVRAGRVDIINQWYAHQSGSRVVDLAEQMADALHPATDAQHPTAGAQHPTAGAMKRPGASASGAHHE